MPNRSRIINLADVFQCRVCLEEKPDTHRQVIPCPLCTFENRAVCYACVRQLDLVTYRNCIPKCPTCNVVCIEMVMLFARCEPEIIED